VPACIQQLATEAHRGSRNTFFDHLDYDFRTEQYDGIAKSFEFFFFLFLTSNVVMLASDQLFFTIENARTAIPPTSSRGQFDLFKSPFHKNHNIIVPVPAHYAFFSVSVKSNFLTTSATVGNFLISFWF